jgi:hypothetical protein
MKMHGRVREAPYGQRNISILKNLLLVELQSLLKTIREALYSPAS